MSSTFTSHHDKLIDQAASWMARLWSDDATKADQLACEAWRQAAPEHEQAWQNLLSVAERFNAIPTPIGKKPCWNHLKIGLLDASYCNGLALC